LQQFHVKLNLRTNLRGLIFVKSEVNFGSWTQETEVTLYFKIFTQVIDAIQNRS